VRYKGPKYFFFYLIVIVFFATLFIFQYKQLDSINLGLFSIKENTESKIELNILNVIELDLTIKELYISSQENICSTGEIYVYGTLRNSTNLVRIRFQDIKTSSSLNIVSKSSAIEPTRNYEQFPLNVYSNNFDCSEEVITIIFEEHININYLLVVPTTKSTSNQVKTLSITAYS